MEFCSLKPIAENANAVIYKRLQKYLTKMTFYIYWIVKCSKLSQKSNEW